MAILSDVVRANLKVLSPLLKRGDLEAARVLQQRTGELMAFVHRNTTESSGRIELGKLAVCWTQPASTPRNGAIMFLHGGGYVAGGFEYVMGFGSALTAEMGRRVLSVVYRLAPEDPYPAALDDAVAAYRYMMDTGYGAEDIVIVGESAGGGLAVALAVRLRDLGIPLPAGIACISPWTDLSLSGASYINNEQKEPSLSLPMLEFYARSYAGMDRKNPYVSPLFADLSGLPPCLIIVGGDEILLDDALGLAERLESYGVECKCHVEPRMWHVFVLYTGMSESKEAISMIRQFIEDALM